MKDDALAALGVPDQALSVRFIRSGGPGGQNVNKVATAVQLSCDLAQCDLPATVTARLRTLAGRRLSSDDVLTIAAQRFRTQEHNKRDALERLTELITQARVVPKTRRATKPTQASKRRRIDNKVKHGQQKQLRGKPTSHD